MKDLYRFGKRQTQLILPENNWLRKVLIQPSLGQRCYFAGPDSRGLAERYMRSYNDGILEVQVPKRKYDEHFAPLLEPDAVTPKYLELAVPCNLFDILNESKRVLH